MAFFFSLLHFADFCCYIVVVSIFRLSVAFDKCHVSRSERKRRRRKKNTQYAIDSLQPSTSALPSSSIATFDGNMCGTKPRIFATRNELELERWRSGKKNSTEIGGGDGGGADIGLLCNTW